MLQLPSRVKTAGRLIYFREIHMESLLFTVSIYDLIQILFEGLANKLTRKSAFHQICRELPL